MAPCLTIRNAADALDFCKRALGAGQMFPSADPQGTAGHAEMHIGDSALMLSDEYPEMGAKVRTSLAVRRS